ncbi:MAG: transglutaminase domain-containing protein [Deltaproteobacteria bacterium]|nr:transglutaminase domain-containing protein [Deltaproteobacteria bacterium]
MKIIRIRATVRVSGQGKCDALPAGLSSYLAPVKYIESHNPEIIRLARRLKAPDAARTARNIFEWVSQNIRYTGYTGRPRGALYALSRRKGDCTELMYLFAALCRAEGIPARCVGGYICTQDTVLRPQDYHNWAEFYLGGTWQISDPLNGVFMEGGSNYIAMRIFGGAQDDPRFEFDRFRCDSNTLRVAMNQ